ncbi:MAG TPA: Asp-tRNA(Asn)/Glu-tRNA(Gln) amidotransferase subunit GatC, partial [Gemmatimonadales bacterium]
VERIARLAELQVDPAELAGLAAQLERIVGFVAELPALADGPAGDTPVYGGPAETALRADVVAPAPLQRSPADIAPEFIDGFFVVPRLGGMEEG